MDQLSPPEHVEVEEGKKEAGDAIGRRRRKRRRSVFTVLGCRKRRKRSGGGRERRRRTKCQMQVRRKMCAAGDQMGRRSIACRKHCIH